MEKEKQDTMIRELQDEVNFSHQKIRELIDKNEKLNKIINIMENPKCCEECWFMDDKCEDCKNSDIIEIEKLS